jgi:hypothetical protein
MMYRRLVTRVRGLLRDPRRELPRLIAERGDLRALLPSVLVLAALGPVVRGLGQGLIGTYHAPDAVLFGMAVGGGFRRAPVAALIGVPLAIALELGAWWLLGWLMAEISPQFGGRRDLLAARKAATAIATPLWLAGPFVLFDSIPHLGFVAPLAQIAGLVYGVLLGVWALPLLLGTPNSKAPGQLLAALGISAALLVGAWYLVFAVLLPA